MNEWSSDCTWKIGSIGDTAECCYLPAKLEVIGGWEGGKRGVRENPW